MYQRPAEDQGESRSLPTPVDTQLHHESVRSTCRLLLLRQQAGGIAGTCGEVQTVRGILSSFLTRTGVTLENQKRIYSVLEHIDCKIETERQMLNLYNSQKQYLLRQMFI